MTTTLTPAPRTAHRPAPRHASVAGPAGSRSGIVVVLALLLIAFGVLALVAGAMDQRPSGLFPTLTVLFGVVAVVAATRFRRGSLVAPFCVAVLLLTSIYGVRPLLMIARSDFDFYGLDVYAGFNHSAVIGFIAVVTLSLGYLAHAGSARHRAARARPAPASAPAAPVSIYASSAALLVLILLWAVVMAWKGGGFSFIATLYGGRSASVARLLAGLPAVVSALPVAGAIVAAAARVTVERRRRLTALERLTFWAAILASTLPPLALGTRRFLLPCLLAAVIAAVQPAARRRVSGRLVAVIAMTLLILAIVPFVRSAGSRRQSHGLVDSMIDYVQSQGLVGSLQPFFVSYDTEMFNYVSYLAPRLGHSIPYGYGRGTLGDLLLNPFPSSLAPADLWSDKLLTWTFGASCAEGLCPVPSVAGVLFYDLGALGVVLGMFAIGWLCQAFEPRLATTDGARLVVLLGAAAYTPVMVRGATMNAVYLLICSVVVALLVWLVLRRARPAGGRHPRPPGRRRP